MNCTEWLKEKLGTKGTEYLCDTVREEAKVAGYTKAQLKQARAELGVKTFHLFDEDGDTGNWFWYLPPKEV